MGLLLILAGAVFGLLFVLNTLVQTLRHQPRITFRDTLLAFMTALVPLAGLVSAAMDQSGSTPRLALQGIAIVLLVIGLLVVALELRRPEKLKNSRGIFSLGVGVLLLVASFTVPLTFTQVLAPALATATPIRITEIARVTVSPQLAPNTQTVQSATATPANTATPTITHTPAPTRTPLATRFVFASRTPEPTPTMPNPCLALTEYNVNLRAQPEAEAEIVLTIPFNTTVTLLGRTDDSVWWFAEYEQKSGWIKGEFLTLSATCANLPVRDA